MGRCYCNSVYKINWYGYSASPYCLQYTVEKEIVLFTELAQAATELCAASSCDVIVTESESKRRRCVINNSDNMNNMK